MSRKSKELDKKLILIGQAIIQEVGVAGLSIREVARVADVNLGMMNYYFDGKEDFIIKCLQDLYTPFIEELEKITIEKNDDTAFEEFLLKLAVFSRNNRKLILLIVKDMLSDDKIVKKFITEHFSTHFFLMKKNLSVYLNPNKDRDFNQDLALQYLISNIGMPSLMTGFKEVVSDQKSQAESDKDLRKRVRLTMDLLRNFAKK